MSKIDIYKQKKHRADELQRFAALARGADSCDKFGATALITDSYKGYYGNSGCSRWPDSVIAAVQQVIGDSWGTLLDIAQNRAAAEAERARRDAEAEAREVLEGVAVGPEVA